MEVKISGLEGAGLGLFAARKFLKGDVITVYLGREVEKDIDSVYSITNHNIVLDCKPFEDGDTLLGAHLANDPNWSRKEGVGVPCNAKIGFFFELIALETIVAGEEILLDYNYDSIN